MLDPALRSWRRPVALRFWAQVEKTDGCWLWRGRRDGSGYGQLQYKKQRIGAHRLSYELHIAEIPAGLWVLHRCDNKLCVRPDHLFLGTHLDNVRDCVSKGRNRFPVLYGRQHKNAKINYEIAQKIRELYAIGRGDKKKSRGAFRQVDIATMLGTTRCIVSNVVRGGTWLRP